MFSCIADGSLFVRRCLTEVSIIEEQQQEKNNKEQNRAIIIEKLSASSF
jgi:hypothetical protein